MAPINLTPLPRTPPRLPLKGYRARASKGFSIYSYILITTFLICYSFRIVYCKPYANLDEKKNILFLFWMLIYVLQVFCFCAVLSVSAYKSFGRMENLVCYLNTIEKINIKMNNRYLHMKIKHSRAIIWGCLLCFFVIASIYVIGLTHPTLMFRKDTFVLYFIYFQSYFFIVVLQLQFSFLVLLVNETLHVFQDRLKLLIVKAEINEKIKSKMNLLNPATKKFHQINKLIDNLIRTIDGKEGVLNFFIFVFMVADLMHACYFILTDADFKNYSFAMTIEIIWISYRCLILLLLIEPCHQTWKQFQFIRVLVSRLISVSTNIDTKENLYSFSYQLMLNVPNFSPLGVCVFRREILFATVGAFVSYFVIYS